MSDSGPYLDGEFFTRGVPFRRCMAWLVDLVLISILLFVLWWVLILFVLATLGLGHGVLTILPLVPFLYNVLSLLGARCATPGQQMMGLTVRRDDDLGPPTGVQALISTIGFYLTLATSGLLLVVALFTTRHRTLHDLVSGLVVVRSDAMETLTAPPPGWNMRFGTSAR